jgi:hypothetical protein
LNTSDLGMRYFFLLFFFLTYSKGQSKAAENFA